MVVKLFKNFPGSDILDISEYLGGKVFKRILGTLFIGYFIISSSILLRQFAEALKTIYFPMTNVLFVILFFAVCIAITNKLEFLAAIKANLIIMPFVLFSSIFLFATNLNSFSSARIFPILGTGFINTFILGLGNISSFAGISFLYFLPPLLKEPKDFKKISIISVVIFFMFLFLNIAVILYMFSFFMSEKSRRVNGTKVISATSLVKNIDDTQHIRIIINESLRTVLTFVSNKCVALSRIPACRSPATAVINAKSCIRTV